MKSDDDPKARAEAAFRKRHRTDVDHRRRRKEPSVPTDDKPDSKSRPAATTEGAMDESWRPGRPSGPTWSAA